MKVIYDFPNISKVLWDGLDLTRYHALLAVLDDDGIAIVIMKDRNPDSVKPWCVERCGSGQYFDTLECLSAHCHERWGFALERSGSTGDIRVRLPR